MDFLFVLILQQHICQGIKTLEIQIYVLEVCARHIYATNHLVQIKLDFLCFDSSTAILFCMQYK